MESDGKIVGSMDLQMPRSSHDQRMPRILARINPRPFRHYMAGSGVTPGFLDQPK